MGLSIITPHFNDFEGLQRIYNCLKIQDTNNWEWIIVDDFSDKSVIVDIYKWIKSSECSSVTFIENAHKTNASVCRNIGLKKAKFENVIFLDADDYIGEDFVYNRQIEFNEFAIFPNYDIVGKKGHTTRTLAESREQLLNSYLSAKFLWQTTCVLWKKEYLNKIGGFDPNLQRLQDVELFIRALLISKEYKIIDNKVDFFYCGKPIRLKDGIVKKSCTSVNYLISKIQDDYNLDKKKQALVKAYYYACVKGLHRSNKQKDVVYVKKTLNLFYKRNYINIFEYIIGLVMLFKFQNRLISNSLFIRVNRYFFK